MPQQLITITGIAASVFTALSLLPQLIKIGREKKAEGISFYMLGVLGTGLVLWIGYGIMIGDAIITVSNATSLLLNGITAALTYRYRNAHSTNN